jgi:hypothetical protein
MRALFFVIVLIAPAMAQTPEAIVRPMPEVFLRERTPEVVAQDEARAAMIVCTRRSKLEPAVFESGECAAAKARWESEVKRNEALQAEHERK